jgi:hypothetical protein
VRRAYALLALSSKTHRPRWELMETEAECSWDRGAEDSCHSGNGVPANLGRFTVTATQRKVRIVIVLMLLAWALRFALRGPDPTPTVSVLRVAIDVCVLFLFELNRTDFETAFGEEFAQLRHWTGIFPGSSVGAFVLLVFDIRAILRD